MKLMFTFLILLTLPKLLAQVTTPTWGIADTNLTINKETQYGIVHDYFELFNYAGEDLNMRWVLTIPPTWPATWDANFTDPSNYYSDVLIMDSADFLLKNPPEWDNKLIIGVKHYAHPGNSYLRFKVFPIDYPGDTLWITYTIIITQGTAWASLAAQSKSEIHLEQQLDWMGLNHLPNGSKTIEIHDLSGSLIYSCETTENQHKIPSNTWPKGLFLISVRNQDGIIFTRKVLR